jgi:hypothetical protein
LSSNTSFVIHPLSKKQVAIADPNQPETTMSTVLFRNK